MPYVPPGVTAQALTPGTHQVYLTGLKPIEDPAKLVKFAAQVVFIATYKSVETAVEIDSVIKFNGSKAARFIRLMALDIQQWRALASPF